MSYIVQKKQDNLVIKLESEMSFPLSLNFKRNGVSMNDNQTIASVSNINPVDGVYTFTLALSGYAVGDVLSDFSFNGVGSYGFHQFNEGLVFYLDDEVYATVHNNDGVAIKFDKVGSHTIQAVYQGNENYATAYTDKKLFYVKQESSPTPTNLIYDMEYVDKGDVTVKYEDGSQLKVHLTQGGANVDGATVVTTSTGGYSYTTTTGADGIAYINLGSLPVGKHTLNTVYLGTETVNDEEVEVIKCSCQKEIHIEKNDPVITYDIGTFTRGQEMIIRYQSPAGRSLNDRNFIIYINNKAYTYTSNTNGRIWIKFSHLGTYKFRATYQGDANMNSKVVEFTKTISQ